MACADSHTRLWAQGNVDVTFSVYIPYSCAEPGRAPCPIVNFGHGLLGSQSQVR